MFCSIDQTDVGLFGCDVQRAVDRHGCQARTHQTRAPFPSLQKQQTNFSSEWKFAHISHNVQFGSVFLCLDKHLTLINTYVGFNHPRSSCTISSSSDFHNFTPYVVANNKKL